MKTITLLTAIAMALVALLGPQSSVGGPMTVAMVLVLGLVAIGIYEAWSNKRGPLGWIVNVVASVVGGLIIAVLASFPMDVLLSILPLEGSLVSTNHPMLFVTSAIIAIVALGGSWITLQLINRFR